jgi:hypothetical protein
MAARIGVSDPAATAQRALDERRRLALEARKQRRALERSHGHVLLDPDHREFESVRSRIYALVEAEAVHPESWAPDFDALLDRELRALDPGEEDREAEALARALDDRS